MIRIAAAAVFLALAPALQVHDLGAQVAGEAGVEVQGFWEDGFGPTQGQLNASLLLQPEFYRDWDRGRRVFTFEPFLRVDAQDAERTHVDIRDLSYEVAWDRFEIRGGIRQVFWGVTESQHLVDIVNQTDLVENLDGEDKLGQPMLNIALISSWGTFDVYLMTGFRERTFPGRDGRFRAPLTVDRDGARYESGAEQWRGELAGRWSHFLGNLDIGISAFHGTSREPTLIPEADGSVPTLIPFYPLATQVGVDAQWTQGPWLWKFEGITRNGATFDRFWAMTGGLEYTLYQVMGTNADLGLVAEVLLDDRGSNAPTPFEDDLFFAYRLAFNDVQSTEVLAGVITDRGDGGSLLNIEASRRLGSRWRAEAQARSFLGISAEDPLHAFRRDDYLSLSLTRFF